MFHLGESNHRNAVLVLVENAAFMVPHAKKVERRATLGVLEVEVGIDPLHKYFEEVGGRETHEKMLNTPFFIILVLLVHPRLRDCEFRVSSHLHKVIDGLDQYILVPDVVLEGH